jgi:ABC-type sugar transport system substrate-binding protein
MCLSACQPQNPSAQTPSRTAFLRPVVIGYSASEYSGVQTVIMNEFIRQAEQKGWKVLNANANSNPEVQADQIDYLLSQGVSAIVASPLDSAAICESIQLARAKGILFFTMENAPKGCEDDMSLLSDNFMAGQQAGSAMERLLFARYGEYKGNILEYQGNMEEGTGQFRSAGFHSVLDKHPDIHIIAKPTEWRAEQFAAITRNTLPIMTIDGIFLHSDCVGVPGVLPVLEEFRRKIARGRGGHIFITGVDGCPETLDAIRDGYVDQSSSQPLADFSVLLDWIKMRLHGELITGGQVKQDGVTWSPAELTKTQAGWQLQLATTSVTPSTVENPLLWGNQAGR